MGHEPERFIGAWSIEDWRIDYADGRVTRPFGDALHGYLVYAACGVMSAAIAAAARPAFGLANAREARPEKKAAAFDGYFHYAGRWRVEGDCVVHYAEMALNPDMTNTEQRRKAVFSEGGEALALAAEEALADGTARTHSLLWRRTEQGRLD